MFIPLKKIIEIYTEKFKNEEVALEKIRSNFASFSVSRNEDVESYLKEKAISHQKKNKSRTYLYINPIGDSKFDVMGYFSIALKPLALGKINYLSNTKKRKFKGKEKIASCYLIGQIGKSDFYNDSLNLGIFLNNIFTIFNSIVDQIGGGIVLVECEKNNGSLKKLYEDHGFVFVQDTDKYTQLLKFDISG